MNQKAKYTLIHLMRYWFGLIKPIPPEIIFQKHINSIAILVQERFGDSILVTPLIRNLRNAFPDLEITLIGVRADNEILRHDPHISRFYNLYNMTFSDKKVLFRNQFDLLFNTKDHPSFKFLYLSRKIKASYRIGIDHPLHYGYFHHLIHLDDELAMAEKNCAILDLLGIKSWKEEIHPYFPAGPVSEEIKKFADQSLMGKVIIGVNLSASSLEKSWKPEKYIKILQEIDTPVIIFSMLDRVGLKRTLEEQFQQVIPSPPTISLFEVAHLVQYCKILISPDTSLIHIASCYNIPVVVMYRTERDSQRFPPYSSNKQILISPSGFVDGITPQRVIEAYQAILGKARTE
jgi:heptosyltransferase-3